MYGKKHSSTLKGEASVNINRITKTGDDKLFNSEREAQQDDVTQSEAAFLKIYTSGKTLM